MDPQSQFQAELNRSDREHHQPTAGAMIGHVTANLLIHSLKVEQAALFATGPAALFLDRHAGDWLNREDDFRHRLNRALRVEGDLVPTTSQQLQEFSMMEENGAQKYAAGSDQLADLVKDFALQLVFITKAIKLARAADHPGQEQVLGELVAWIKEQVWRAQAFRGKQPQEDLLEAD